MSQHPQDLHELADLAQQFAARGWIVRLEPTPAGADAADPAQVTVRQTACCAAPYVLRQPSRHQILVGQLRSHQLHLLGTAVDVDDALALIRHSGAPVAPAPPAAPSSLPTNPVAGTAPAAPRPALAGSAWSEAVPA